MAADLAVRIRDFSDEYTTVIFRVADLGGSDVWTVATGLASGIESALAGAILGTLVSVDFSQYAVSNADEAPASGEAQREKRLRLAFQDDVTGDRYGITIGTADWGALAQPGTDLVPLDHAEVAPIVTWMEANALSKAGNAITVTSAELVGRNV